MTVFEKKQVEITESIERIKNNLKIIDENVRRINKFEHILGKEFVLRRKK